MVVEFEMSIEGGRLKGISDCGRGSQGVPRAQDERMTIVEERERESKGVSKEEKRGGRMGSRARRLHFDRGDNRRTERKESEVRGKTTLTERE